MRPKRKGSYHHGDLRRALVVAARTELKRTPWSELSLRSVARRAGVTHTAAYHHFADKNALLCAIAAEGLILLDKNMADAMDAAGDDPVERLLASSRGYLKTAREDPAAYDLMFNAAINFEGLGVEIDMAGRQPFERLLKAVIAAREATGLTVGDTLSDALMHWELVHGCANLMRAGKLERIGVDMDAHVEAIIVRLRGLYPRRS